MTATLPADGRIAFSDFTTQQIYTVNPDGTGLAQLTHEPAGLAARWPNWSPDGSRILFVRFNPSNGAGRIWIMKATGTGQRQLTSDVPGYRDYQPKYTPDGKRIVFTRCSPGDGLCAIWIMRADGTHRRLLVPFLTSPYETNNFDPAVSPDGRRISYERFGFHGITSQVWVADINGKHAHPLTAPRLQAVSASWSPDGSRLAFASNCCRAQSIVYVMRTNGTGVRRLAVSTVAEQQLRSRLRAQRGPDRVLQRPALLGLLLRGPVRDAGERRGAAPDRHRPEGRGRHCLGTGAGGGPVTQHAPAPLGRRMAGAVPP